jgi:soluble lytic murein transglycosylase-like protein
VRFIAILAVLAAAARGQAAGPFDQYHDAIGRKLDAIIATPVEPPRAAESPALAPAPAAADAFPRGLSQLRAVIDPILRSEGLPSALAAVVLIESGGRPDALSPKGARGLWQLMPDTARLYGLQVDSSRDERLDVPRATRAAARLLRDLYAHFGDWGLALAAYNAGKQAVENALERAQAMRSPRWDGFLPEETRRYVPAVLATMRRLGASNAARVEQ